MFKNTKIQWSFFGIIAIIAAIVAFKNLKHEDRDCNSYDEQMWTSASITSYNMFFNGHERNLTYIDNWFSTYAMDQDIEVFTKHKNTKFDALSIKFPYDYAANKNRSSMFEVQIDTIAFPKKQYQWFDKALWTFGWRAPNMGKYVMGWYIQTFAKEKPNPNGYFQFLVPDKTTTNYKPSTEFTTTSFSYAPTEYVELARIPNAIATVLIILAVFYAGWKGIHFSVGAGAAIWLIANTTFMQINTAAGLDSFSILFTFGSIALLYYNLKLIQNNANFKNIAITALLTGVAMAFAVSSKLNGALVFYICGILYVLALLRILSRKNRIENIKQYLQKLVISGSIIGFVGIGLFLFFNPQMQIAPIKMVKTVQNATDAYFEKRAKTLCENQIKPSLDSAYVGLKKLFETQKLPYPEYQKLNNNYTQLINETKVVFQDEKFFLNEQKVKKYLKLYNYTIAEILKHSSTSEYQPLDFQNWMYLKNNFAPSAKLVNERIGYVANPKRYFATFGQWLNFKNNPMDGAIAITGIVLLLTLAWKSWNKNIINFQLVLLLSFIVIWYGNTDFLWQDWARYYIAMFPLYSLLIMSGIYYGITKIISLRKKE